MNISSILITILGIIIILALYVMSRYGQKDLPSKEAAIIPDIQDKNGHKFTSILDDIPASDGSLTKLKKNKKTINNNKESKIDSSKKQLVLFISGKDENGLDGSLVKQTLLNNGLKIGDKEIYHFYFDKKQELNSLFRVANGVEPWTLKDEDLLDKRIIGISIVMLLPTVVPNKDATILLMNMADAITEQVNGVLKNQQQELLSKRDRTEILKS